MSNDDHGRRTEDQLLPQFLQEIGAMRECVSSLDETLKETRTAVETIGKLAVKTDGEFRSFKYTVRMVLAISSLFVAVIGGALGYYFNQRDNRIEQIAEQMNTLTRIAISNQELNRAQAQTDKQTQNALIEALEAIRKNQDGIRRNHNGASKD
jgi:hypothetical protein